MNKTRILIVEDEPIIAADLADRITDMGFEAVHQCDTGEAAILFLKDHSVDLILMDIQLDGQLDGVETAQKILEKQHIPVIYLTSNADDATFARAVNTRPAAFLSKPFRGKDLKHAIELAISHTVPPSAAQTDSQPDNNAFLFDDRLFIKVKDKMVRLFFSDILWLEADDYYCKLITREKEFLIGQPLKQMGEALARIPELMRVHRSFIVNLSHVEEIGDLYLTIHKKQIPVNKASRDEIITRLQKI